MAALIDQLRQLRDDLRDLVSADEEQEVMQPALSLVDAVLSEARSRLPDDSTLTTQLVDLISAETIEAGQPVRAAELLIITGQLLAVLDRDQRAGADDAARHLEQDRQTWATFQRVLPRAGVIVFLEGHPWEYSFEWEDLVDLERYLNGSQLPDHRFFESEVEASRLAFCRAGAELLEFLNARVGRHAGTSRYRMYPGVDLDWETEETSNIFNDVRRASELAAAVVESYDTLWSRARSALHI